MVAVNLRQTLEIFQALLEINADNWQKEDAFT
jgi:hypothetical protein